MQSNAAVAGSTSSGIHSFQSVRVYPGTVEIEMSMDRVGFYRDVGLRLQHARKNRGLTQEELASQLEMPRPSYANVERGRTRVSLDIIWRASVLLGVPLQKLVPEPLVGEPESAGLSQPGDLSSTSADLYWHFAAKR
jgi:DNA-binding XRE family transcriptional regulator